MLSDADTLSPFFTIASARERRAYIAFHYALRAMLCFRYF